MTVPQLKYPPAPADEAGPQNIKDTEVLLLSHSKLAVPGTEKKSSGMALFAVSEIFLYPFSRSSFMD